MTSPSLVVLAAGLGSRYGGFKQIEPIGPGGEVILDYSIYDAMRAGFEQVVMVTVPDLEAPLRDHFARTLGDKLNVVFTFQGLSDLPKGFVLPADRKKPWGTAHAVWAARSKLNCPFAVINADDFYGPGSYKVLGNFLRTQQACQYCMVGFELLKTLSEHGTVSRGICSVADDELVDVVENTKIERTADGGARTMKADGAWHDLPSTSIASMNMWGFDPSLLAQLEVQFQDFLRANSANPKAEFFIPTVVDRLIKEGKCRCRVLKTSEQWFGVTYKEDRASAATAIRALVDRGVYPQSLRL